MVRHFADRSARRVSLRRRAFPARRSSRIGIESLEERLLMAVVQWDGGGGDLSWQNRINWVGDALPVTGDDVVVGAAYAGIQVSSSSNVSVNSLTSAAPLRVIAGTFSVSTTSNLESLTLSGGQLAGAGDVTVAGSFSWTGGSLRGGGRLIVAPGATGTLTGTGGKVLGRVLENRGRLDYTGSNLIFGPAAGEAGVLLNEAGATLTLAGDGDLGITYSNAGHRVENRGTLVRDGVGVTELQGVGLVNTGSVQVRQGALNLGGATNISILDPAFLDVQPGASFSVRGALAGDTHNVDLFRPLGTVVLNGPGTSSVPQLFEVMGRDLGNSQAAFDRNFRYGVLRLNSTFVRLDDAADNAPGTGAEALYVDTLIVPAGSTLDLNALRVYARSVQVAGTVIGGTINAPPDGGPVPLNTSVLGSIGLIGEIDEWTFFGRAGEAVTVFADPGAAGSAVLIAPTLSRAGVRVLAPNGAVIGGGNSAADGQTVSLLGVQLPATGTYRVQVRAATSLPDARGHYLLAVSDARVDTTALVLNQTVRGVVDTAYSADRWTFAARANRQVRLDVIGSAPGVRFKLTGPNGWVGFIDLAGDSELVTLPADGPYTLEAYSGGAGQGAYSFALVETNVTPLALGVTRPGTLVGTGDAQLFALTLTEGNPLLVTLDDSTSVDRTEVYARLGTPPTRRDYDLKSATIGADHTVLVPYAPPGTWYVLVYAESAAGPSGFTIRAASAPVVLGSVSPDRQGAGRASLTLRGSGFVPGTRVDLVTAGGTAYSATAVGIDSFTQVTAEFNLTTVPAGVYDVRATLPDEGSDTLIGAFRIESPGQPRLETNIVLPGQLGRHVAATLYLEYRNAGSAPMPAPILTLQSGDPDGSDLLLLTLDRARLAQAIWSSATPDGFYHSVQVYASGATPGVLLPGESARIPVYYAGLEQGDSQVEFEIRIHEAGNPTPIDWAALKPTLKPSWMAADAWDAVFANLVAQVGPTWGDYVRMLGENATYLGRLGEPVSDVSDLFGFELLQANGLSPQTTLAGSVDAAVPTPGLPLAFGRSFGNTITERYRTGPFGRGWTSSWDVALDAPPDGTVVIRESADSQRRFQPDSRTTGTYFAQQGDTGKLRRVTGGAYELTEANGLVTRFLPDGRLESVQDVQGNRITAGYTAGKLTSLTHSSGGSLAIGYTAAGLVERVADSYGRVTIYGYDPTNTHLLTVTGPGGTTTYAYSTGAGAAREHALTLIQASGGAAQHFEYDARGRLLATYLTGNVGRIDYGYDAVGRVTATDPAGVTSALSFDHRGLLIRQEDGLGNYTRFEYNDARQLVRETNSLGQSRSYIWSGNGQMKTAADEYGKSIEFTLGGPRNQPTAFTDARGSTTRYGYDAAGNATSTTYADETVERVTYDARGNVETLTNRRGQTTTLRYNAAGQVEREEYPGGATDYTYDARGRLETAVTAEGTTRFDYDTADRLTRVTYPNGRWVAYGYDAAGRRERLEDSSGSVVHYGYDLAGRLDTLRDVADALIVRYTYDPAGRLGREDKGNGTYTEYGYDPAGRVEHIIHRAPGGSVNARFDYTYDALGRRKTMGTLDGAWAYTYDLTGQLTRAVFTSTNPAVPGQDLRYEYDAAGNRVRTIANSAATVYAPNAMNQYTSAGGTTFRYDTDGNLVEESGPSGNTRYTYNVQGRLVTAVGPQGTWAYEYDVLGNRTAVVANGVRTEYLIDPSGLGNVVGEFDAAGSRVASYAHGLGLEGVSGAADGWDYYDFDALGSTAGVSGVAGGYLNQYSYDPFGSYLQAVEGVANPFEFVGQAGVMTDGNGLLFMRARYYSSEQGRFTNQDPLGLGGGQANFYAYISNDPVNGIDPTGLKPGSWSVSDWFDNGGGCRNYYQVYGGIGGGFLSAALLWEAAPVTFYLGSTAGAGVGTLFGDFVGYNGCGEPSPPSGGTPGGGDPGLPGLPPGPGLLKHDPTGGGFYFDDPGGRTYLKGGYLNNKYRDPLSDWLLPPPPPSGSGGRGDTEIVGSFDPNEKFGAAGSGLQAFISPTVVIPYRVNFENLGPGSVPSPANPATAPAQRVEVTDQLTDRLDWATIRFTEFGFGDTTVAIPQSATAGGATAYFFDVVPMTFNGRTFDVVVELSFDAGTGQIRAVFQSIDPGTGLPPDVLTGFLPPEDGTGRGKGYIAYSARPRAGLPTGTEIRNVALIRFDGQAIISTDQVDPQDPSRGIDPARQALNTIDADAPTSAVAALPTTTNTPTFTLDWSGSDTAGGSGVAAYDIFVSVDGSPFAPFLTGTAATSAPFTGAFGHTYSFYSVATDGVGHRQPTPASAQASTLVTMADATISLTSSHTGPVYGQALSFTATVAAVAGVGMPTGTVQFLIDGTVFGSTAALINGSATLPGITSLSAGGHTITVVYSGDSMFTPSTAPGLTQMVSKAPLTVRADDKGRPYGQDNPPLTYTFSGFVNGEDAALAGITGTPLLAAEAGTDSPAGTYAITAAVGSLAATNYVFIASDGLLTVGKADATMTLSGLSLIYDGTPRIATVATDPAGLAGVAITYDGSTTPPTDAGTYSVVATLSNPNYQAASATGSLTIARAPQTVTFDALPDRTYGDAPFSLTAFAGSGLPVTFTGTGNISIVGHLVTILGAGVGTVTAHQAGDANHEPAPDVVRTFRIAKATAVLALGGLTGPVYNGSPHAASATTDPEGLGGVTITYNGSTTPPTAAGSYAVVAALEHPNYQADDVHGTLVVAKAQTTVTLASLAHVYDGTIKTATATTDLAGLAVTFAYARDDAPATPTNAGSYAVTATIDAPNYQGTATGTLVIARATPTITWSDPAAIVAGTPLGASQLNATASVSGSFVYTPAAGTILGAGTGQVLVVEFMPADPVNYTTATGSVRIDVVAVAPPTVESVVINDGSAQRSMVTRITITFSGPVTLDPGALELREQGGGPVGLALATSQVGGKTVVVLSFAGSGIVGGSLADGTYCLILHGDKIRGGSGQALDGDADGLAGGDFVDEAIARLFGDTDGDGDEDYLDYLSFRTALDKKVGDAAYLWYLDYDRNGIIDRSTDFAEFSRRRGKKLGQR
jgi:RHS repeat-associated protein